MRITRSEAFQLINKWAETDAPANMVFWGCVDGDAPFLKMPVDEVGKGPDCVHIIGPHDSLFSVSVPAAEDDGLFYFCIPREHPGLSDVIKGSRLAAEMDASNTPALCIGTKAGILMIYDHPGDEFLDSFEEQFEVNI